MAREPRGEGVPAPGTPGGAARGSGDLLRSVAQLAGPGGSESLTTVLVAFGVNVLIAAAKSAAAGLTGSASLVAEAAHSWADTGNEIFLPPARRRRRAAPARPAPPRSARRARRRRERSRHSRSLCSSVPACSAIMHAAYQSRQFASPCPCARLVLAAGGLRPPPRRPRAPPTCGSVRTGPSIPSPA
jgi:hypothetical protein